MAAIPVAADEPVDLSLPENGGGTPSAPAPWTGLEGGETRALLDDFNRADGPLGADWTVQTGSFAIVSQAARGSSFGLATHNSGTGDAVSIDVATDGSGTGQYAAAVLNYGGGSSNIFVKVQSQGGSTDFTDAACYTGNNGSSFGLGFFSLGQTFSSATMTVSVDASRTVTIDFTNVNGGALPDQQYTCTGAPPAEGPAIGIAGWQGLASIDNFSDGTVAGVDLSVTKTSNAAGTVYPGDQITYTIDVTNNGPDAATGVTVTDPLSPLVSYVSDTCSGTYDGGTHTWTWTVGGLANAASATCDLVVEVAAGAHGSIDNTASVAGNESDPTPANDSSTASVTASSQVPGVPALGTAGAGLLIVLLCGIAVLVLRRRLV